MDQAPTNWIASANHCRWTFSSFSSVRCALSFRAFEFYIITYSDFVLQQYLDVIHLWFPEWYHWCRKTSNSASEGFSRYFCWAPAVFALGLWVVYTGASFSPWWLWCMNGAYQWSCHRSFTHHYELSECAGLHRWSVVAGANGNGVLCSLFLRSNQLHSRPDGSVLGIIPPEPH